MSPLVQVFRRRAVLLLSLVGAAATALLCGGCASTGSANGDPAGTTYVVKAERAPFYKQGPAQGYGPDANLTQGATVVLVERGYGYSRVNSPTYGDGWMATDDIEKAPPEPEPEPARYSSAAPTRGESAGAYNNPGYDSPDVALPEPDVEPAPLPGEPQPTFRY